MVLPLKLTQFYGSRIPRPRIYPDVKFNDHRVDPPPSAHDALLHWARDAHWSMGGLSFKRMRMQGKIEGSIRRLRAEKEKSQRKRERKSVEAAPNSESDSGDERAKDVKVRSNEAGSTPNKRKRTDLEAATPSAPKPGSTRGGDSPEFVPATQEKKPAVPIGSRRATRSAASDNSPLLAPASRQKKNSATRRSPRSAIDAKSSSVVPASRDRMRSNSVRRSSKDSPVSSPEAVPVVNKLLMAGKKLSGEGTAAIQARKKAPVRKMLLREDSSDSDDEILEFLKQKDRPLRRSRRLGGASRAQAQQNSSEEDSGSGSDSE